MAYQEKKPLDVQIREIAEALIIAGLFLWFANTFVLKTFYIPSGSMEDTLLIGDHLFVNRFIFGPTATGLEAALLPSREIQRGDVVIFRSPQEPGVDLVKRCVGLPGDLVEIRSKDLYINGQEVEDDTYTQHQDPGTYLDIPAYGPQQRRRDHMAAYHVPEDSYFCLGDNRDRSYDSRFWGPVPVSMVKGRASIIYWSFGGDVPDGGPTTLSATGRRLWSTVKGFFTETRWERTFQLVR
jgi:signal peptidase I